ncbi:MAG: methyltransferase domain-containing protein [Patescibacteria group bacterium]
MFSNPKNNLDQIDLIPGMTVADFGAGIGHYAFAAAKMVGATGHVYALEIKKEVVESVAREARHQHIRNLDALWVDLEKPNGSRLKSSGIDRVILSNVLFQIQKRDVVLAEIFRILRPQGRVLLIDWSDSSRVLGPASDTLLSEASAKELFLKNGFVLDKRINAGTHHYGMIFKKGVQ